MIHERDGLQDMTSITKKMNIGSVIERTPDNVRIGVIKGISRSIWRKENRKCR